MLPVPLEKLGMQVCVEQNPPPFPTITLIGTGRKDG